MKLEFFVWCSSENGFPGFVHKMGRDMCLTLYALSKNKRGH